MEPKKTNTKQSAPPVVVKFPMEAKVVSPVERGEWTYEMILVDIIKKNGNRKLCDVCEPVDPERTYDLNGNDDCVFFRHSHLIEKEMEKAMANPDSKYKEKQEQGARLACYKLWTLLEHGRLGKSRRRPLPVCVEIRIKLMKPSDAFAGYKAKEKEDDDEGKQEGKEDQTSSDDDDTWEGSDSPLRTNKKQKTE